MEIRLNLICFDCRENVSDLRSSHRGSDCSCCRGRGGGYQPGSIGSSQGFRRGEMAENDCLCNAFLQAATPLVSLPLLPLFEFYIDARRVDFQERSRILLRFADLVEKHSTELAALETWNNGKPYEQSARTEIPIFVRLFHYYAG